MFHWTFIDSNYQLRPAHSLFCKLVVSCTLFQISLGIARLIGSYRFHAGKVQGSRREMNKDPSHPHPPPHHVHVIGILMLQVTNSFAAFFLLLIH